MYNIYYTTDGDIGTPELTNIIDVVKTNCKSSISTYKGHYYTLHIFVKVIKQFRCFSEKLLTREITR
jgi:hypothetical protein